MPKRSLIVIGLVIGLLNTASKGQFYVRGPSDNRNDITLNPMPASVLLDPSLFTVSEITHSPTPHPVVSYHGVGDTDQDG